MISSKKYLYAKSQEDPLNSSNKNLIFTTHTISHYLENIPMSAMQRELQSCLLEHYISDSVISVIERLSPSILEITKEKCTVKVVIIKRFIDNIEYEVKIFS